MIPIKARILNQILLDDASYSHRFCYTWLETHWNRYDSLDHKERKIFRLDFDQDNDYPEITNFTGSACVYRKYSSTRKWNNTLELRYNSRSFTYTYRAKVNTPRINIHKNLFACTYVRKWVSKNTFLTNIFC